MVSNRRGTLGSTPVGLCAQACNKITEPSGMFWKVENKKKLNIVLNHWEGAL